jgi:hypothetical protein
MALISHNTRACALLRAAVSLVQIARSGLLRLRVASLRVFVVFLQPSLTIVSEGFTPHWATRHTKHYSFMIVQGRSGGCGSSGLESSWSDGRQRCKCVDTL